ncbi:MAG: tetratricopeptide repeat protein [Gallionella sp.]
MPVPRQSTCWIPRAAEAEFLRLLSAQQAKILPLTGGGGIGKTSLLLWCFEHCQEKGIPALYLDLPRLTTSSSLNMLLQLQTVNTPTFDTLRKQLRSNERLADLLKSYGDSANTASELLQKDHSLDQEFGKIMGAVVGLCKIISQLWQRADQQRHEQLVKQPEETLLRALAKDFSKQGVMLLDTLEQAGKQKLQTRLLFYANGEINTRVEDTPQAETLLDYCAGMAGLLFQYPVVMVLAGRAPVRELKGRSFSDFAPTLSLPAFDTQEIQSYLQQTLPHLPPAQPNDLAQLKTITCGNPLLLERVATLLSDWDGWAWQPKQWQPLLNAYQHDPNHGLLLYVTQRLADHIQADDRAFWRLALPRHAIQHEMADILFPASEFGAQSGLARLNAYAEKGILFAGRGENLDKYYLHDETRAALQAWAEREKCWLNANAEQIHAQLGAWFAREGNWTELEPKLLEWESEESIWEAALPEFGNPLLLEASHHLLMADADFEQRYPKYQRNDFWVKLSSIISWNNAEKMTLCAALPNTHSSRIKEVSKMWSWDESRLRELFKPATQYWMQALSRKGQLPVGWDNDGKFLENACSNFPDEAFFLGNFAWFMQTIRQDYDQAESLYQRAIASDSNDARNLGNFAWFMQTIRQDYDQAESLYQRAIASDPNDAHWLGNFALFMHTIRQNYVQAGSLYQQAIEVAPKHARNLNNFALFMRHIHQDYDQAENLYQQAIKVEPKYTYALCDFALFMQDIRQNYDRAEKLYQQAIKDDPKCAHALGNFAGFMHTIRQNHDQAESLYQQAIEADPEHARNLGKFAFFMATIRKDYERAKVLYQQSLALDDRNTNLMGNLAQLFLQAGELVEGWTWLEKAFATPSLDSSLELKLWFYLYAHFPVEFPKAEEEIQTLLDSGVRSEDWDFSGNLAQAKGQHPDFTQLQALVSAINTPV